MEKAFWNAFLLWHSRGEHKLPYLPLEKIIAIQNRRVRSIVRHAYETVPYYKRAMDESGLKPEDFRTAEDLSKLPLLTSDHYSDDPQQFLSRSRYIRNSGLGIHSTGTTGMPRVIYHNKKAMFLNQAAGQRQREVLSHWTGGKLGYREMTICIPGGGNPLQVRRFFAGQSWIPKSIDLERDFLYIGTPYEESWRRLNAFKPDVILGTGSYIGYLFRWAHERNLQIHRPRAVWYGADAMPDFDRRLLEEELCVPVVSTYQTVESRRLAFQCERREGFHICLDLAAVRIVDARGNTLGPGGRGEIVISNLINRATVLLNYKLGDIVTLGSSPCTCGRTLPVLEKIDGRSGDWILSPDGEKLHFYNFIGPLQNVPGVVQVQLIQKEVSRFHILVVKHKGADWPAARDGLNGVMRAVLGDGISLEVEQVNAIPYGPGGKIRPVLSMCRG
jgi:phenylacetate-CoA ligase